MADVESRRKAKEQEAAMFAATSRLGELPYPLNELLNQVVFIEGIRMNYWGLFIGCVDIFGSVCLLLRRCHRVGDFNAQGPNSVEKLPGAVPIPWDFVHAINLAPAHWPQPPE